MCLQGFFCDVGSFNATQTQCPADHFCAKGTTAPEICLSNYARTCTKGEGELCNDNTLCLGRQCSGLNLTTVACEKNILNRETFSVPVCSSLFAAGFRTEGDVGCKSGSACANFHKIGRTVDTLFSLNLADAILEVVGFVVTVALLITNFKQLHKPSIWLNRFNVYILLAADLTLQLGVLVLAADGETRSMVEALKGGNCWSPYTPDANSALEGVGDDLQSIMVLGFIELAVVIVGIIAAVIDRLEEDEDNDKDHSLRDRIALIVSIMAIFFDVLLSVVDFAVYTVNSRADFRKLQDSLKEDETTTGFSDLSKCLWLTELSQPTQVVSEENCLPSLHTYEVEEGYAGWVICIIVVSSIWTCCMCCRIAFGTPLVSPSF